MTGPARLQSFDHLFFAYPADRRQRLIYAGAWLVFYVIGLILWTNFFNAGRLPFISGDWMEKSRSLGILRDAVLSNTIPYHVSGYVVDFHPTNRFLGMPHLMFSPQIILLRWLDIGRFLWVNMLLFYSIGFAGCWLVARRFRFSLVTSFIWLMLFNFNGHIVAHLSVGHIEWFGYFLLPFVFYFTMDLAEGKSIALPTLAIGMIHFILLLQGAFHFVIWCLIFHGLLALLAGKRRLFVSVLLMAVQVFFMGAFRIQPAAISFGEQLYYVNAYPSLGMLLECLVTLRDYTVPLITFRYAVPSYFWEYDMYISLIGFLFILYFGTCSRFSRTRLHPGTRLFGWPIAIMLMLAVGDLFYLAFYLPKFPILGTAERAPARMIILPMVFLFGLACMRFQQFWNRRLGRIAWSSRTVTFMALAAGAYQLWMHLYSWSIVKFDTSGASPTQKTWAPIHIATMDDPDYVRIVNRAFLITILGLACWLVCLGWALKKRRSSAE